MLPQLLGEDSGPNQAVPTTLEFVSVLVLVEEVLRLLVVLLLVDEVLRLEVVAVDEEDVSIDVEYEADTWVVFDVTDSGAVAVSLVVGEKAEV